MAETANALRLNLKAASIKELILFFSYFVLLALWVKYLSGRQFAQAIDVSVALVIIMLFYMNYNRLNQDNTSFFFLVSALALHNLGLYSTRLFGINFDHYMHFAGSFAVAMVADRLIGEKSRVKRLFLITIIALGVGSVSEIVEWTGFALFGDGDGFFLYGMGDEGGYTNVNLDMIFNGMGGLAMGLVAWFRGKKLKQI
ncbi:hypothetical protein HYX08_01830 [Candidatus Woesearchaeota archaeon]|nr:hypothetical protein [Candidatus Woesearchaeota archaeon]